MERKRGGNVAPDSCTVRLSSRVSVMGITPATTGTSMPRRNAWYRKRYSTLLSKNIWVVRKSAPASTLAFK